MEKPLHVFCCYARTDQSYLFELNKRLIPLQREGLIVIHADINISPGENWEQKIHHYLNTAHVILLLVSSDFIASEYCYSNEMMRALDRHNAGDARVIPIILRPVDLRRVPFGKIQSLPTDAKPVTRWADQDEAFLDVANGIEEVVRSLINALSASAVTSVLPFDNLDFVPNSLRSLGDVGHRFNQTEAIIPPLCVGHLEVIRTYTPFSSSMYHDLTGTPPPTDAESIQQRKTVVEEVYALLIQPHISSVVLTGIGGIGKSTLAALVSQYSEKRPIASTCPFAGEGHWLTMNE